MMSPRWWHSPDDSDFAKYLLDIAPPADNKYVSQIKCPSMHQERICMGVTMPSDFAHRYLTCLSPGIRCSYKYWLNDPHDHATVQELKRQLDLFKAIKKQSKTTASVVLQGASGASDQAIRHRHSFPLMSHADQLPSCSDYKEIVGSTDVIRVGNPSGLVGGIKRKADSDCSADVHSSKRAKKTARMSTGGKAPRRKKVIDLTVPEIIDLTGPDVIDLT